MASSDESDYGDDMLQMMEDEDVEFLKSAVQNRVYSVLNKVKCSRKTKNTDDLEEKYEKEIDKEETVNTKILLPIKSKKGLIIRTAVEEEDKEEATKAESSDEAESYELEGEGKSSEINTPVDVLAKYNESLTDKKIHIGYLCAGLLESPEDKIGNFRSLFAILNEDGVDAIVSVRKLVLVSLLEVFKDILPAYQIKHQDFKDVKLKKDTLKLYKGESALLQYYKKYLQILEKNSKILLGKSTNGKSSSKEGTNIAIICIRALCELLVAHPYFNYSSNIAQTIVPFLNCPDSDVREMVAECVRNIFKQDKKDELSLTIVRGINAYLKTKAHKVRPNMLEVLLHLRIKNVNLDREKEVDLKEKKLSSQKQNVLRLSKKERKRKKRLQELEKEMLEVKAEENKQNKQKNLTEIVRIVFGIYFRILKNSENNQILGMCLEGLAKFSHCINLEYYMDLVGILDSLLKEDRLSLGDRLNCVRTVFAVLASQDDVVDVDPGRFYGTLYAAALGARGPDARRLLETVDAAVIARRKRVTGRRLVGFVKRAATLALQLAHGDALGALAIVRRALQLTRYADVLLDVDQAVGDGDYQPFLGDPEYSNAASTALYELAFLRNHYHPTVRKFAGHVAHGCPANGEGSLDPELGKKSLQQLFSEFDMSTMAFNPSIPIPKKTVPKLKRKRVSLEDEFANYCRKIAKNSKGSLVL